jgi:hypothetical protein
MTNGAEIGRGAKEQMESHIEGLAWAKKKESLAQDATTSRTAQRVPMTNAKREDIA